VERWGCLALKLPRRATAVSHQYIYWYSRYMAGTMPGELQRLLHVLNERNIGLGHDDLAWAFEETATAEELTKWVNEYLSPHNLLTLEELHLYVLKVCSYLCDY